MSPQHARILCWLKKTARGTSSAVLPTVATHDHGQDAQAVQAPRQAKDARHQAAGEEGHPAGVLPIVHMLLKMLLHDRSSSLALVRSDCMLVCQYDEPVLAAGASPS